MGWYTKAQTETPKDISQIMQETMVFAEEVMSQFEELRNYATNVVPRRAKQIARIATNPDSPGGDLGQVLGQWGEEMDRTNTTLNEASVKNQARHKQLNAKWKELIQATKTMQIGSGGQSTPSVESRAPGAM